MSQYIITDGERFIYRNHSGKYVPAHGEAMADLYSKKQAEAIYNNQLPKALKSVFHVERYDRPHEGIKEVTKSDIDNTEKLIMSDNIKNWIDKISDLNGLSHDVLHRKEELLDLLSNVDKELSDLLHYIEFCNLNAYQGYMAYKMIKERRIRRRSIKNELVILDTILSKRFSDLITDEVKKIVNALDKRTYEPRVITELFDI